MREAQRRWDPARVLESRIRRREEKKIFGARLWEESEPVYFGELNFLFRHRDWGWVKQAPSRQSQEQADDHNRKREGGIVGNRQEAVDQKYKIEV